jgi:hypothetical protein
MAARKPSIPRRAKGKSTKKCAVKRPCKANARDEKYLRSLGERRLKALAKSRGKRAPKVSVAEAVRVGRKRLASIRKYNKKR